MHLRLCLSAASPLFLLFSPLVAASPPRRPPARRQDGGPPPTEAPKDPTEGNLSTNVIIAIAAVLGGIALVVALLFTRRYILSRRLRMSSTGNTQSPLNPLTRASSSRTLTAAQLVGSSTPAPPANPTPAARRGANRRNNVRRTESGHSVKTLPEYRKEAGDEEMVLVKQREHEDISEDEDERSSGDEEADRSNAALLPSPPSSGTCTPPRQLSSSPVDTPSPLPNTTTTDPLTTPPHSAPPVPSFTGTSRGLARTPSLSRRGWGEAPTYLEAMSSPPSSFPSAAQPDLEAQVPPPSATSGSFFSRTRTTSGFRDFLSRAGFAPGNLRGNEQPQSQPQQRQTSQHHASRPSSQLSLLLHPQTSRLSSPYPSPWASTHSLHISSPLPHTATRISFGDSSLPKAGLSDQQMRFLSSSEAVNLAGMRLDDPPATRRARSRSEATVGSGDDGDVPPPSWAEVDGERRRGAAEDRVGLARPVRRVDELEMEARDPPSREEGEGAEEHRQAGEDEAIQHDERPRSASPVSSPTAERTAATASAPAPSVEIEPPTPISATPPPLGLAVAAK